jgi:aminopeptidase N
MVYSKGSLFFHTLREEMGDEAFFLAVQNYFEMNQFEIGTPEELLGSFSDFTDRQLNPVYQEWLDITVQ